MRREPLSRGVAFLKGHPRTPYGHLCRILQTDFGEFSFRNCLENSRRPFNRASLAAASGRSVPLRPHLAAFGTTILEPTRFFKQFLVALGRIEATLLDWAHATPLDPIF